MKIDETIVDKLSNLAKLEFSGDEKKEIIKDLNRILTFVEKLNELETTNVETLVYMSSETNIMREDKVEGEVTQQEALKNAPLHDSDYIKVPKVIKNKELRMKN
jgi:aspartyl-tRNA(Asn)/glutamyl-tRNA(Gln) amidotransferase subunit C